MTGKKVFEAILDTDQDKIYPNLENGVYFYSIVSLDENKILKYMVIQKLPKIILK